MTCSARTVCVLALVASAVGCGSSAPRQYDEQSLAAANMFRKISTAYRQAYQAKKKPPTADDLKPFLSSHGVAVSSLVSPRDQQPIVLVPFVPDAKLGPGEEPILAYEAAGVNGERMLVDSRGLVRVVSEENFSRIKFASGHKPK